MKPAVHNYVTWTLLVLLLSVPVMFVRVVQQFHLWGAEPKLDGIDWLVFLAPFPISLTIGAVAARCSSWPRQRVPGMLPTRLRAQLGAWLFSISVLLIPVAVWWSRGQLVAPTLLGAVVWLLFLQHPRQCSTEQGR